MQMLIAPMIVENSHTCGVCAFKLRKYGAESTEVYQQVISGLIVDKLTTRFSLWKESVIILSSIGVDYCTAIYGGPS